MIVIRASQIILMGVLSSLEQGADHNLNNLNGRSFRRTATSGDPADIPS